MSSFAPSSSSNSSVPCRVLAVTRLVLDNGVRGLLLKAIGQVDRDRSISLCLQAMARFFHIILEKVGKFDVDDILSRSDLALAFLYYNDFVLTAA